MLRLHNRGQFGYEWRSKKKRSQESLLRLDVAEVRKIAQAPPPAALRARTSRMIALQASSGVDGRQFCWRPDGGVARDVAASIGNSRRSRASSTASLK
jgi:hypothetical protein